jgi:hypothetical protein
MAWFEFWRRILRPIQWDRSASSAGVVHEELMFHFRELVHEKLAAGATFDTAWNQAEQQFGSVSRYENECQSILVERRVTWRIVGALVVLLLIAFGLLSTQSVQLRSDLRQFREDLAALRTAQSRLLNKSDPWVHEQKQPSHNDLIGVVCDMKKRPLPEADVLVILKTWPYGDYRQEDFATTTDSDGRFVLPKLVPSSGRYAVQVAAVKDGYALHSFYYLRETAFEHVQPVSLQLEPASQLTLLVRDHHGEPVSNVKVVPMAREPRTGDRHQIYFQGSEPVRRSTDAEGRVSFGCFVTGDTVEVAVQMPGGDWNVHSFDVFDDDFVVDLASTSVVVN